MPRIATVLSFALLASIARPLALPAQSGPPEAAETRVAAGQTAPVEPPAERWTVEDILSAESMRGFRISPDNEWVVSVKSTLDKNKDRFASNLWLTQVSSHESWPLTRGSDTNRSPKWSPDGRSIAFLSSRKPKGAGKDADTDATGTQLWLLRLQGGEPYALTRDARGLRDFAWKGESSDTLILLAEERKSQFERVRKEGEDDAQAVEDTLDAPPVRLWTLDLGSLKVRRLTRNTDWISSMAVSPDGRLAVTRNAVSLSYSFDQKVPPRTYLVNLETGQRRRILDRGRLVPDDMQWALDGRGFYFSYRHSTHPLYQQATISLMGFYDIESSRMVPIDLAWDRALGSGFDVTPDGFLAQLADGVHTRSALYTPSGNAWKRKDIEGTHAGHIFGPEVSRDGRFIVYSTSTASTPTQPFVGRLDGYRVTGETQLATLNPSYAKKPKPRTEIIHWTGAHDEQVEGILSYPLHYQPGRRYPLIVSIHGGPAGADRDLWSQRWAYPTILYNQLGAFVFKPNYHGSSSYGLKWVESIGEGKYYELEIPDIEKGVDYLINRGLAHPDSIATQGWSNGAILSTELTTRNPDRYKASSAGAGDVEWISDWGNVDFGAAFDNYYFGASPLQDPELYIRKSPYFRLDKVKTPTLLFFGTEDRNVPPSQGWSQFRALQQLGNTEVRFVLFPGEPHGLRKLAHQRRKVNEEIRWLKKYLLGREEEKNLALADNSPLAALLAREEASRVNGAYGISVNGVIVPETVNSGDLEVGRFEVTRAQWHEFEPKHEVPAGTENYPANHISLERAQAYVAWLSQRTGASYRLPTRSELEALIQSADSGITLDYWAGYAPNPEDVGRLSKAVAHLSGDAPLLKAVGSFGPDAKGPAPHVYDLAGNVAEWATRPDGTGELLGNSADRPRGSAATTGQASQAGPAYRGLRVVKG